MVWLNQVQVLQSFRKVVGAIRSLVTDRSLQFECSKLLYEALVMPVLLYNSDSMVWGAKEESRIWAVQIDNLIDLLGIEC